MDLTSPQLLPWHATLTKCMTVKYNSMTLRKFKKQKQEAKEQLKLHTTCALCLQQINLTKGTSKEHTTVEGFSAAFGSTEWRCQQADLHRSCRRHDLSFTCRLFLACVTSVSAQVCCESWDESNFQFSTNLCGNACYAGYKQSYVRHETKPLSLPVLHLKAHLTSAARLWPHGLWLGHCPCYDSASNRFTCSTHQIF